MHRSELSRELSARVRPRAYLPRTLLGSLDIFRLLIPLWALWPAHTIPALWDGHPSSVIFGKSLNHAVTQPNPAGKPGMIQAPGKPAVAPNWPFSAKPPKSWREVLGEESWTWLSNTLIKTSPMDPFPRPK